ncbi:hypothetical protein [Kitasatospora sp. NPDC050463]|uniref:hypothetical protein n=1 Tax=Kitasatospora sp. NPDC050463 TaxID=3155786 RepID=UPI0033DE187A
MTNRTVRDAAGLGPPAPRLPRPAAPVDRSATAAGTLGTTRGVEADSIFDTILHGLPIPQIPPPVFPGLPPITLPGLPPITFPW